MKKCSMCFTEKPVIEFAVFAKSKDGLQSRCKACCSAYAKAWKASRKAQPAQVVVDSKVCYLCGLKKPISQFPKKAVSKDKHLEYCKPCWAGYINKIRRRNAKAGS